MPSRLELSPEEKLERKASYEGQLAKVEKLVAENKNDRKRLKDYREIKVILEQKIAELSKEEVVTA